MFKSLDFNKGDIERQLTLCLLGTMFLFLAPFSIYRLLTGDIVQFAVDATMALIAGISFVQSWRSKKSMALNYVTVLAFLSVVSVLIHFKGMDMVFWVFPSMIGTYFLLASTPAFITNVIFVGGITFLFFDKFTKNDIMNIYPSLLLVCVFGYVLSKRSEFQNNKLNRLASVDALTEVKNRRSFEEKMAETLEQNKRSSIPVCLLLLDLDFFKKINDNYGHKQGDKVLFDFAQRVKLMVRNTDYVYRFGGEEFAIIATNSELKEATLFAETIRETIQHTPSLAKFNMTVSIGVSQIKKADDADSWFRRTDLALYESKTRGRNCVYIAEEDYAGAITFDQVKDRKITPAHPSSIVKNQSGNKLYRRSYDNKPEIKNTHLTNKSLS